MKKNRVLKGVSRSQRRRLNSEMFATRKLKSPGLDLAQFILTNPHIFTDIANAVIKIRMGQWRSLNSLPHIRKTILPDILKRIRNLGEDKLRLSSDQAARLAKLAENLINELTADKELNSQWASSYLVSLHRDLTGNRLLNFYLHESPFYELENLTIRVFTANHPYTQRKQFKADKIKFNQHLKDSRKEFFRYMPADHNYSNPVSHKLIQIVFMGFFLTVITQLILNYYEIPFPLISCLIGLFCSNFIHIFNGFLVYLGADVGVLRTPFGFHQMDEDLKAGLLVEIGGALDSTLKISKDADNAEEISVDEKKEAKKIVPPKLLIQQPSQPSTTTSSTNYTPPPDFSWKKIKKRRLLPEQETATPDIRQNARGLLQNARLAVPIIIRWETLSSGPIIAIVGQSIKDIYPVWSGDPRLNAVCRYCYLYAPRYLLENCVTKEKKEEEIIDDVVDECIEILKIGHVVPPTGHAGIVSEAGNFKIKSFSKGHGHANPALYRCYFFPLKHPKDLKQEAPRIDNHQYQLFTPKWIGQTH